MLSEFEESSRTTGMSESRLDEVDDFVKSSVKSGIYSAGVYLVARNGEIVRHKAFGYLDKNSYERETMRDSVFDLLSITKSVATAICAMKLVEEGTLSLETQVSSVFKPFSHDKKKRKVRLRHFMTMSSGLPFDVQEYREKYPNTEDLWEAMISEPGLEFDPGTRVSYSDLGYRLFGKLIDSVSETKLDKLAKQKIFDPFGMKYTTYNPDPSIRSRCAETDYSPVRGRKLIGEVDDELDFAVGGIVGCDGLFSTAKDLATYMQLFLNDGKLGTNRVLEPETMKLMTTDQVGNIPYERKLPTVTETFLGMMRGMGFELKLDSEMSYMGDLFSNKAFGKFGGTGTFMVADPETDLNVVLLTNKGWPGVSGLLGFERWFDDLQVRRFFDLVNSAILR